jgi:hypothetical protein
VLLLHVSVESRVGQIRLLAVLAIVDASVDIVLTSTLSANPIVLNLL